MSDVDQIISAVPMDDVARRLGVDAATAEQATRALVPTLLAGLGANAADPAGAASLSHALQQHDGSLVDGGVNLDDVDTDDGEKIAANIFGSNKDAVVSALADSPSTPSNAGSLLPKLLPILAPIVLSWLAKRAAGSSAGGSGGSGGGLGDILGSVLGGASGGSSGSGGLGDILGGLLGGGKR